MSFVLAVITNWGSVCVLTIYADSAEALCEFCMYVLWIIFWLIDVKFVSMFKEFNDSELQC